MRAGKSSSINNNLAVDRLAHNPKVGGSNPPPATKLFIGLRASDVFTAGAKKGNKPASAVKGDKTTASGSSFHFAFLTSCLSAICTTLLLASRFDSIMALP
jgi:hypothetical protein